MKAVASLFMITMISWLSSGSGVVDMQIIVKINI